MFIEKPFSPACEKNKDAILKILKEVIPDENLNLLEIGSGTGQHAVFMTPKFRHLNWTTSDILDQHDGIRRWMQEFKHPNLTGPIELEIGKDEIPRGQFDLVFSANVLHIISKAKIEKLIEELGEALFKGGQALFYGPFNSGGRFTAPSNETFDQHLKTQDPESGIRDFEEICRLMKKVGFDLLKDFKMPANNRMLYFKKVR